MTTKNRARGSSKTPVMIVPADHGGRMEGAEPSSARVTGFMKETRLDSERSSALALQSPNGLRLT